MPFIRILLLLALPISLTHADEPIPVGSSTRKVDLVDGGLELFCYKPKNYKDGPLLVVFHGVKRNAEDYRDNAIELADRHGALVVAPKFDLERFPTRAYQRGGLLDAKGGLVPPEKWTWSLVPRIVEEVRKAEGRPTMPYSLIGHSGGGQFLVRLAGFMKTDAQRIVAANPGTHLFPNLEAAFPYGYGGLPQTAVGEYTLKRYLAQPLTIYLGTADTEKDENLEVTEAANKQGAFRLERGRNAFAAGQKLAKDKGWDCKWELVEAEGVGHDSKKMFGNKQCDKALKPK